MGKTKFAGKGAIVRWFVGLLALCTVTCSTAEPELQEPAAVGEVKQALEVETVTARHPTSGTRLTTFMSTTDHLTIFSGTIAGTAGVTPWLANFGSGQTYLQASARSYANIRSVGSVKLDANSYVGGSVWTKGSIIKQPPVTITGGQFQGPSQDVSAVVTSWDITWGDLPGPDVILPDAPTPTWINTTVPPGAYGTLDVYSRNHIFLSTGVYAFERFKTEPEVQVHLDTSAGPIVVYVRENFGEEAWQNGVGSKGMVVTDAGSLAQFLLVFMGTKDVFVQGSWQGTIVAQNAKVKLERPSNPGIPGTAPWHRGAYFAKSVEVASSPHTVLHTAYTGTFPPPPPPIFVPEPEPEVPCILPDSDSDGVNDCIDECRFDPDKVVPGVCNCGTPDADTDSDGAPDCIESPGCETNPTLTAPGQCGSCDGDFAAAGTPCTDDIGGEATFADPAACDGAGTCGDPEGASPGTGCFYFRALTSVYWVCPGPVARGDAQTACRAVPERKLVTLDSRRENALIARVLSADSYIGANDFEPEGQWRWSTQTSDAGYAFWSGGFTGERVSPELFEAWAAGQPQSADCATLSPEGEWAAVDCGTSHGFVCEQPLPEIPPPPPPPPTGGGSGNCPPGMPPWACDTVYPFPPGEQAENCVPATDVFPALLGAGGAANQTAETFAEIDLCQQDMQNGLCTESDLSGCRCEGAASPPPPGSVCPGASGGEFLFCQLENVLTEDSLGAPCVEGVDCCSWADVISEAEPRGFDIDAQGFTYVDDAFRGTANPSYASGTRVTSGGNPGAALQVSVGGVNNTVVTNMSGGWRTTFTLAAPALVGVELDYNLTQSAGYEADEYSEALLSVDGVLQSFTSDSLSKVTGNGNGGSVITTGYKFIRRNVGVLGAGTHEIVIGAYNNQKTVSDEATTVLIDNVRLFGSASDCPSGYICGRVAADCELCDEVGAEGQCQAECPETVLRCGTPLVDNPTVEGGLVTCADAMLFPGTEDRCSETEICAEPEAFGNSNPEEDPRSDLVSEPLDPVEVFGEQVVPEEEYVPDPACASPPCAATPEHRWCHYSVNTWDDPVIGGDVENPLPPKPVGEDTKQGTSGSDLISFTFDPGVTLDYQVDTALPFGEAAFSVNASATFKADVAFNLPPAGYRNVSIVDAGLGVEAGRCGALVDPAHVRLFGTNFLPTDDIPTFTTPEFTEACETALDTYGEAFNRAKKAYRDALELVRQYNERVAGSGAPFPEGFCESLIEDPPQFFPAHPCDGESTEATINRFIDFYHGELLRTAGALAGVQGFAVAVNDEVVPIADGKETQTVFQASFPLGPIPMLLQVEAFMDYGVDAFVSYNVNPSTLVGASDAADFAMAKASAVPYAGAGVSLFVGAGFGINGFEVSAGVEGAVTLGRVTSNNWAGAGIGIQRVDDDRDFPEDIIAAAAPGYVEDKFTALPGGPASSYQYTLRYQYGSNVGVHDIMKGTVSGRVRLKLFFFKKTFRKLLFSFPGFGGETFDLLSGGDDIPLTDILGHEWGLVQMPLPFVPLAPLEDDELSGGTAAPVSMENAAELFFDGLCECKDIPDGVEEPESCFRHGECCSETARCFDDPDEVGDTKYCSECRDTAESCNENDDCCSEDAVCLGNECQCVPPQGECAKRANCCDVGLVDYLCEDDPAVEGDLDVCRCRGVGEDCNAATPCCNLYTCSPITNKCIGDIEPE